MKKTTNYAEVVKNLGKRKVRVKGVSAPLWFSKLKGIVDRKHGDKAIINSVNKMHANCKAFWFSESKFFAAALTELKVEAEKHMVFTPASVNTKDTMTEGEKRNIEYHNRENNRLQSEANAVNSAASSAKTLLEIADDILYRLCCEAKSRTEAHINAYISGVCGKTNRSFESDELELEFEKNIFDKEV